MKKSIVALCLVLVLSLCSTALAAGPFNYTAAEYMESYSFICEQALGSAITWSDPVDTDDGLTGWGGEGEEMANAYVYTVQGETPCVGIGAQLEVNVNDETANAQATAFGRTIAAIVFSSRYQEAGRDLSVLQAEVETLESDSLGLVEAAFTSEALTAAMTEPYTTSATIGGHTAQITTTVDLETMTMKVTFIYVP